MKISETNWNIFVLFIDDNKIVHSVGYESLPNVATLQENFNELKMDEEFKLDNVDTLLVDIISKEKYISFMGDFEIL
jgi:hypothetical protein